MRFSTGLHEAQRKTRGQVTTTYWALKVVECTRVLGGVEGAALVKIDKGHPFSPGQAVGCPNLCEIRRKPDEVGPGLFYYIPQIK